MLDATAREAEGADDARQELRAQRALPAETSATERLPSAAIPLSERERGGQAQDRVPLQGERDDAAEEAALELVRPAAVRSPVLDYFNAATSLSRDAELASSCGDAQMRPSDPLSIAR